MPPWFDVKSTSPILCHEFKLVIQLSGKGNSSGSPWVGLSEACCILFENMLVFCQGSFPSVVDKTAPPAPSNITCLGMVFLENLGPKTLAETPRADDTRSFILTLGRHDSITFNLQQGQPASMGQEWYKTLQMCLERRNPQHGSESAYIQVKYLRLVN